MVPLMFPVLIELANLGSRHNPLDLLIFRLKFRIGEQNRVALKSC